MQSNDNKRQAMLAQMKSKAYVHEDAREDAAKAHEEALRRPKASDEGSWKDLLKDNIVGIISVICVVVVVAIAFVFLRGFVAQETTAETAQASAENAALLVEVDSAVAVSAPDAGGCDGPGVGNA